jgi:hypothetical protein
MNVWTSRWRWAYFAVLALALAGVVVYFGAEGDGKQEKLGILVFAAAAIGYVAVRVALIVEDRRR